MKVLALLFLPLAAVAALAFPDFYTAIQRSRQKRTMNDMRMLATRIEAHQPIHEIRDGWGNPIRVHIDGKHYAIRAANADGRYEKMRPSYFVTTDGDFKADVVLVDGTFMQFPEGICGGDIPGKGPLGECMACHPHRIQKR